MRVADLVEGSLLLFRIPLYWRLTEPGRIGPSSDSCPLTRAILSSVFLIIRYPVKPEYISGHSSQAVALAVKAGAGFFALPLACRVHEGAAFSNRDRRTLLDKMAALALGVEEPAVLVADAYFATAKVIVPLLKAG